jgi:hypothetical protein
MQNIVAIDAEILWSAQAGVVRFYVADCKGSRPLDSRIRKCIDCAQELAEAA